MVYRFGISFCFAILFATVTAFAATEERVTHQTFPLNQNGIVELSNVNGDVTIRGWDKNEVDVKATKRGPAEYLDQVEIDIHSTPERLSIETKYPRWRKETNVSVRYELMVPRQTNLDSVANVNGGIDVSEVYGEIKIETVNGSAEIQGTKASVHAETVNGSIAVQWSEFPKKGEVTMRTVNGSIELNFPGNANADVAASSMNGSIHADFPIRVNKGFLSRKLSGRINEGGTNIDLSTINGAIDILKTTP